MQIMTDKTDRQTDHSTDQPTKDMRGLREVSLRITVTLITINNNTDSNNNQGGSYQNGRKLPNLRNT